MITEMPATRRAVMRTLITPAVRAVAVQEPCCVSFSFRSKRLVGLSNKKFKGCIKIIMMEVMYTYQKLMGSHDQFQYLVW